MAYTSITITRIDTDAWIFTDNENVTRARDFYKGGFNGEYFHFSASGGEILYNSVPWSIISYVDNVDPENSFTPESPDELFAFLKSLTGFFFGSYDNGGGGIITDYTVLGAIDVAIPTLTGQAGKRLGVNETGTKIVLVDALALTSIKTLEEWVQGDVLLPNKFLLTNNDGTKIIQGDIELIVNTPIAVDEFRVIAKGTQGGVPNEELYVKEIGDVSGGTYSEDGRDYSLVYNGGTSLTEPLNNYTILGWINPQF